MRDPNLNSNTDVGVSVHRGDHAQTNRVTSAWLVATRTNMAKKGKGAARVCGKTSETSAAPVSTPQRWTGPRCRPSGRPAGRRQFQGSTGNILALRNGSTSVPHTSHSPLFTLFPIKFSDWEPVRVTGPTTASRLSQNLSLFVAPKHQTDVFLFSFFFSPLLVYGFIQTLLA